MNILYLIQIVIINTWILFNLKSGGLNKLISPKFNNIILVTGVLVILIILLFIYLFAKKKVKPFIKFDMTFFLVMVIVILLFSDKKIQSHSLIDNKYKGSILFSKFDSIMETAGIKKTYKKADISKIINLDSFNYHKKDLMQIYNDISKIADEAQITSLKYNIETIGQIYVPSKVETNLELYEKEIMIVRFLMVCCVADMVPVGIIVENNNDFDFRDEEQWISIKGKIEFMKNEKTGDFFGFLRDENIQKIEEPEIPYLYPVNYID